MTALWLPYKDGELCPDEVSFMVSELRGLRDAYRIKALAGLCRRFGGDRQAWERVLDRCAVLPVAESDGILIFASLIRDITDWAAVTRFVWLANKVWDAECRELYQRNTGGAIDKWEETHGSAKPVL